MNNYIDGEEQELIESLNEINLKSIKSNVDNMRTLQKAAQTFVKKQETKMNIRISTNELKKIKQRAESEGLKYQTFVKSVLHKYLTGQPVEKVTK